MIPLMLEAADVIEQQQDELSRAADLVFRARGLLDATRPSLRLELLQLQLAMQHIPYEPKYPDPEEAATQLSALMSKVDQLIAEVPDRRKSQRDASEVQA